MGIKARVLPLAVVLLGAFASAAPASQDAVVIAPLTGSLASHGQAVTASVRSVLGEDVAAIDDGCDTEGGERAVQAIDPAEIALVIGLPCIDAFDAAMPILAAAGIPTLVVGIEAPDIAAAPNDVANWPVFRVAPPATEEADVLGQYLADAWREAAFALVDDGTLYGRQLTGAVRQLLAERAMEPVFVDTYRPLVETQAALVRRLRQAGATHAVIGGEARDAAVIANDAQRLDYALTLAGGSFLIAPPEDGILPDGTLIAAIPPETDLARVAAQIAGQALADTDRSASGALANGRFETDLGPLRFDASGEPDVQFYRMHTIQGGELAPLNGNETD